MAEAAGQGSKGNEGVWDESDLERRLCHALDIATQTVRQLAADGYTDSLNQVNSLRPEKLISETAFLLLAASTVGRREAIQTRIHRLASTLIPFARSERILLGICLNPALTWDYAEAHVCLSRLGYKDASFDDLLRQTLKSQINDGHERLPYRVLEQEWVSSTWKALTQTRFKQPRALASNSILTSQMDLLNGSREDVYAFTHTLMYVADFNVRPRPIRLSRSLILESAEAALARCLDNNDYDLGGEVLLAWPLTGTSWSATGIFGFQVLLRVDDQAGFLPAPNTRLQRLDILEGEHRTAYFLATAYHTVYVMGLLCAAALQHGRTPPARIPTSAEVPTGSARRILAFVETSARRAHWQDVLDELTEKERDAISSLLFAMAMSRNINRHEFRNVRKLLEIGYSLGLANSPASSQAAEMLERLAVCENIMRTRPVDNTIL